MEEQKSAGQPVLSETEQREVESRSAPRTEVVYEAMREEGEGDYLGWILPTLAGNIIGGTTLVAALGHAQVAGEAKKSP